MEDWLALREHIRKYEGEAIEICSDFLAQHDFQYLGDRLDYDVRSEFGNLRVLLEVWLNLFRGDHVRLIDFQERAYDDRDGSRHEPLIEVFLVTLAATILGGVAVEEYKARRSAIAKSLRSAQVRCRLALSYLFDTYALEYLRTTQTISEEEFRKLDQLMRKRMHEQTLGSEAVNKTLTAFYSQHGVQSSSELVGALEAFARGQKGTSHKNKHATRTHTSKGTGSSVGTVDGLAVSPGIAEGFLRLVRKVKDTEKIREGDIGLFLHYNIDMIPATARCSGVIGMAGTGGITSHLAIMARTRGIPAVGGVTESLDVLRNGRYAIVDGNSGKVYVLRRSERKPDN